MKILSNYKNNTYAIVHCKQVGKEDIYRKLKESGILFIKIVTDLISRRKQNLSGLGQKYLQLRQDPCLEMKTFTMLRCYSKDLNKTFKDQYLSQENASSETRETAKLVKSNYELGKVFLRSLIRSVDSKHFY